MSDPRFDDLVELSGPLARQFAEAGQTLHLVGGVVRDAVLGRPVRGDIDLTTDADPDRIKAIISGHVEAMWTQGERFGTIGCRVDGRTFEITTHRVDRYEPGSRKPTVRFTNALEADLARRDFTVNAMAVMLPQGELVDPFAGQADLAAGVLRTPLSPEESFSDDPLRMLRAARFTASLDLVPRPELVAAMAAMSDRLDIVSVERRRDELDRLLLLPDPGPGLSLLVSTGLGARVVPELGDPSAPLDAVRRAPARLVPRLATLLAGSGEAGAVARLRALRSTNEQVDAVRRVVAAVATLNAASDGGEHGPALDGAVRRFVSAGGRHVADAVATLTALRPELGRDVAVALDRLAAGGDLDDLGPQLDGDAVQRVLGIAPGPEVGEALAFLQRLRWDEGTLPGDAVRERLRRWWTARAAPA